MLLRSNLQLNQHFFRPKRAVFQGVDKAPPSPETFKGKETPAQESASEMASQTPSSLTNAAVTRAGAIQTKYTQNTQILAQLIDQPLIGSTSITNSSTIANDNASSTNQTTAKKPLKNAA